MFVRFQGEVRRLQQAAPPRMDSVPPMDEEDEVTNQRQRIPPVNFDPDSIFLCRRVYDFKLKRLLKNPSI